MRKAAKSLSIIILFALGCIWIYSCGSGSDLLDEQNSNYTGFISFSDGGQEDTLTIDVLRDLDCDNDGNATDPEPFTDVLARINISVDENAPGITLRDYQIEFIPISTPDPFGTPIMPPDLTDLTAHGSFTFSVPSGGDGSFTITCMNFNTKDQFVLNWPATLENARYTIRVTLNFEDEYLEERQIILERTVLLDDYDRC